MAELAPTIHTTRLPSSQWFHDARRARRLATVSLAWLCFEGAATTTAGALSRSSERRARQLVAVSFFLLAPYIAFEAGHALLVEHHAETTLLGIWWLDPLVALAIAALAVVEGCRVWRGESCGCATCATESLE